VVTGTDDKCVLVVVSRSIRRFYGFGWKANFYIAVLELILGEPLIVCRGKLFVQNSGMATGLSSASTIANVYLSADYDGYLQRHIHCRKLIRYIDDGCMIISNSLPRAQVREVLCGWHPSVRVLDDEMAIGRQVHVLDLCLFCTNANRIAVRAYRKPTSIYDYLPPHSSHPTSCTDGIVHCEMNRLLVTNTFRSDYAHQVLLFFAKLRMRGYNIIKAQKIAVKYCHADRPRLLAKRWRTTQRENTGVKLKTLGVTVKYCHAARRLRWNSQVGTGMNYLSKKMGKRFVFRPRFTVGRNLFRLLYSSMWRTI